MDYDERLSVPWWWWLAAAGLVGLLGAEIYAGLGWVAAVATYAVLSTLVGAALLRMGHARVQVSERQLAIGRRGLALDDVTDVIVLDPGSRRDRMGPAADSRAVLVTRPWITTAVELRLRGGNGAPYWLVSTRSPETLASAVRQACGAPSQHGSM